MTEAKHRQDCGAERPSIGGLLSGVTASVAAITAVGTILGYKYLEAYYGALGAGWVMHLMPLRQMVQAAAPFMWTAGTVATIFFLGVKSGAIKSRSLLFFGLGSLVACALCMYVASRESESLKTRHLLAALANGALSVSFGLLVAELATTYKNASKQDVAFGAFHVLSFAFSMVIIVPSQFHRLEALLQKSGETHLPSIVLSIDSAESEWFLVTAMESNLLVMQHLPNNETRFRIAAFSEVRRIQGVSISEDRATQNVARDSMEASTGTAIHTTSHGGSWWAMADWWVAIGTFALFLVTAALAYYTYHLWKDAKESATKQAKATTDALELSRATFSADHRPWLNFDVATSSSLAFTPGPARWRISLVANISNVGKSPAMKVWFSASLFPYFMAANMPDAIRQQFAPETIGVQINGVEEHARLIGNAIAFMQRPDSFGTSLFPGESTQINYQIDSGSEAFELATHSNNFTGMIELHCCVTYESSFPDKPHITAKSYHVFKVNPDGSSGKIDGAGEEVLNQQLNLVPHQFSNMSAIT